MFDNLMQYAINFYHEYSIVVIVIAIICLIFAYKKPKESFKFVVFLVILVCVIYAIGLFGESVDLGKKNKDAAIHKTKKLIGD